MHNLIRKAILFSFCVFYTLVALYDLLILYVTKFSSQPWKPKDHSNAPACLTDPKYGVHKFAKVNVSLFQRQQSRYINSQSDEKWDDAFKINEI